eukprot:8398-Heterococcus_DN1.PRE.9
MHTLTSTVILSTFPAKLLCNAVIELLFYARESLCCCALRCAANTYKHMSPNTYKHMSHMHSVACVHCNRTPAVFAVAVCIQPAVFTVLFAAVYHVPEH